MTHDFKWQRAGIIVTPFSSWNVTWMPPTSFACQYHRLKWPLTKRAQLNPDKLVCLLYCDKCPKQKASDHQLMSLFSLFVCLLCFFTWGTFCDGINDISFVLWWNLMHTYQWRVLSWTRVQCKCVSCHASILWDASVSLKYNRYVMLLVSGLGSNFQLTFRRLHSNRLGSTAFVASRFSLSLAWELSKSYFFGRCCINKMFYVRICMRRFSRTGFVYGGSSTLVVSCQLYTTVLMSWVCCRLYSFE
jgi:hypothetical protein